MPGSNWAPAREAVHRPRAGVHHGRRTRVFWLKSPGWGATLPPFPKPNHRIMKKNLLFGMMLLAGPLLAADSNPKDDVKNAAAALGAQPNYSWHSAVESPGGGGRFNGGPTDGKTEKGGYTQLNMTRGDNTIEAILHGTNGVIRTPDNGWQTLAEATQDNGGGPNPAMYMARMLQNYKTPDLQAASLANQAQELKQDTNGISGDLTEDGAKALLAFRPRGGNGGGAEVTNPKGSVTFWIANGQLTKYQFHVTGTVSFNGNDRDVDRTTTVEIKDVGTTKIEVPDDAKAKLQ